MFPLRSIPLSLFGSAACLMLSACASASVLEAPISKAEIRATPLPFGLYVTPDPEENPIDPPERFIGYHSGLDYEVTEEEINATIRISAICAGEVVLSGFVEGYGGLVAQACSLRGMPVTVLYGHLALKGLAKLNRTVGTGAVLGYLAPSYSKESDGNRKHLHLGIRRGHTSDVRGYVQNEEELKDFIDPGTLLPSAKEGGSTLTPYWQEE